MKILVEVEVPEGNTCSNCQYSRHHEPSCGDTEYWCVLFQDHEGGLVVIDDYKLPQCKEARRV